MTNVSFEYPCGAPSNAYKTLTNEGYIVYAGIGIFENADALRAAGQVPELLQFVASLQPLLENSGAVIGTLIGTAA